MSIPAHTVGAFARNEVFDAALAELGGTLAGSGGFYRYNSRREGDVCSTRTDGSVLLWLPPYTLVDAGLSYTWRGRGAQVTVTNLLNERYRRTPVGIDHASRATGG